MQSSKIKTEATILRAPKILLIQQPIEEYTISALLVHVTFINVLK